MEITVRSWASTFVKEDLKVTAEQAVLLFSFYWLVLMITRLLLGSVLKKTPPFSAEYVSLLFALIGSSAMIFSHNIILSICALFLAGLGLTAGFPVLLG